MSKIEKKGFFTAVSELLSKVEMKPEDKAKLQNELSGEIDTTLAEPPKIAIIGKTGVGKSSTINALFGTNLAVSDNKACTAEPQEMLISGKSGDIIVYDMPGVGEDIVIDETYIGYYKNILPKVDIALWVIEARHRAMAYDQMIIKRLEDELGKEVTDRMIFGVNQVDLMEPRDWIDFANIPSKKQEANLEERIKDITAVMSRVIKPDKIVFYSAMKRFRLVELFNAMIDSCAHQRGWALNTKASIADYTELMDPEFLKKLKQQ